MNSDDLPEAVWTWNVSSHRQCFWFGSMVLRSQRSTTALVFWPFFFFFLADFVAGAALSCFLHCNYLVVNVFFCAFLGLFKQTCVCLEWKRYCGRHTRTLSEISNVNFFSCQQAQPRSSTGYKTKRLRWDVRRNICLVFVYAIFIFVAFDTCVSFNAAWRPSSTNCNNHPEAPTPP